MGLLRMWKERMNIRRKKRRESDTLVVGGSELGFV
jgi:hypothetical protein